MAEIHLLGTGSGRINAERCASAYLLETGMGDVLFDAGEPVALTLARRGYDWSRLSGLVITHTHADHTGGVPMLMQQLHLSGRGTPLAVHAPEEYASRFLDVLRLHYLYVEGFSFRVETAELRAGRQFTVGGIRITPSPTGHLQPAARRIHEFGFDAACEAFAMKMDVGDRTLFYSGDVNSFEDIRVAMDGSDLAIIDSTHIDLDSVLAWAADHPATRIILSHVADDFDASALDFELTKAGITAVTVATDGEAVAV